MKTKTLFILVLTALLLAGCSGPSSPPIISLSVDGQTFGGFQSPYCWDRGAGGEYCADPIYPPPFLDEPPYQVTLPIQLSLESPLPDSLTLSLSSELFGDSVVEESIDPASSIDWSPNVPPGEYILSADADWKQGYVGYWFLVSIP